MHSIRLKKDDFYGKVHWVLAVGLLLSGCVSTVTTYDANGKMIGMCESKRGFVIGGGSGCTGSADGDQFRNMKPITLNRQ